MGRFALLVGVSQYGAGYEALPGSIMDVEQMEQVLRDPAMGGFAVEKLLNPDPQTLREKIEEFFSSRSRDDVLLFYFSGHGALDNATGSRLYLATRNTRKEKQQLVEATAVEATRLHHLLGNSRSKQKIIILDCCFSGAAADLLKKGDKSVNLESLKAQGAVILASCNSMEVSFQQGTGHGDSAPSIYTRYLVEGIRTGAAQQGNSGWILTQDLHDYAKRRCQTEQSGVMEPQIIVLEQEGYQIPIAKAPQGDPKVEFRKSVATVLQENDGTIQPLDKRFLEQKRKHLGLTEAEVEEIIEEQKVPFIVREEKRTEYREAYQSVLAEEPLLERTLQKLPDLTRQKLQRLQMALGLSDEDVRSIEAESPKKDVRPPSSSTQGRALLPPDFEWKLWHFGAVAVAIAGLIFAGFAIVPGEQGSSQESQTGEETNSPDGPSQNPTSPIAMQMSLGERELVTQESSDACGGNSGSRRDFDAAKQAGIESFNQGAFSEAISAFESAIELCPNAPETFIYLNNAKVASEENAYTIAVPVPLIADPLRGHALMMLRGFAQAQDEINATSDIKIKLQVINDKDSPDDAEAIAQYLVSNAANNRLLAVAGHWSSGVSEAAASVYNAEELVFITPLSTTNALGEYRPYVFRTNVTTDKGASALANYILNTLESEKAYVFYDPDSVYSNELANELNNLLEQRGVTPEAINLSIRSEVDGSLERASIDERAVFALLPSPNLVERAIEIANQRSRQVAIVGDITNLYVGEAINREQVPEGMVLAPAWNIDAAQDVPFVRAIREGRYWAGGDVSAAAALSYSTLKALTTAIEPTANSGRTPTSNEIVERLVDRNFAVEGAFSTPFQYDGDIGASTIESQLVKVCPDPAPTRQGQYKFLPIAPEDLNCPANTAF